MENNILIAEFLGLPLPTKNLKGIWEFTVDGAGLVSSSNIEDLYRFLGYDFDTDWNGLMKVVEKIESLSNNDNVINWSRQNKNIFDFKLTESKIQSVYNACVEFINWFNKQSIQ